MYNTASITAVEINLINDLSNRAQMQYTLEDDILNVSEHDADTLKKQTQKMPLQLRTLGTISRVIGTIQ